MLQKNSVVMTTRDKIMKNRSTRSSKIYMTKSIIAQTLKWLWNNWDIDSTMIPSPRSIHLRLNSIKRWSQSKNRYCRMSSREIRTGRNTISKNWHASLVFQNKEFTSGTGKRRRKFKKLSPSRIRRRKSMLRWPISNIIKSEFVPLI